MNLASLSFARQRTTHGLHSLQSALASAIFLGIVAIAFAQPNPAPTPPMGWNSYDAYGLTIGEADFRNNVIAMGPLKQFGWSYAVIDEGWYMENPFGKDLASHKYVFDKNGLLVPVASRFPSAAGDAGFKPLADWVHAQGFKFGIHIVRGIPRPVVHENLPIAGSRHRAADAADTNESHCAVSSTVGSIGRPPLEILLPPCSSVTQCGLGDDGHVVPLGGVEGRVVERPVPAVRRGFKVAPHQEQARDRHMALFQSGKPTVDLLRRLARLDPYLCAELRYGRGCWPGKNAYKEKIDDDQA